MKSKLVYNASRKNDMKIFIIGITVVVSAPNSPTVAASVDVRTATRIARMQKIEALRQNVICMYNAQQN